MGNSDSPTPLPIGGHTIAKHVGKSEVELRARLAAEPRRQFVSTFKSLDCAERVIYRALRSNKSAIEAWAKVARTNETREFFFTAGETLGSVLVRATNEVYSANTVCVVLKMQSYNGKLYYILTTYLRTLRPHMRPLHPYPYLAHLFSAYFHEDALDDGQTDDDIIREFVASSHIHDVLGARADILRFLHENAASTDLVSTVNRTFKLALSIGTTDAEATAWLTRAQSRLDELGSP